MNAALRLLVRLIFRDLAPVPTVAGCPACERTPIFDALAAERLIGSVDFDRVAAEWQDERGLS